ncbi:MAG TPA: hypothetical protein VGQ49_04700 [Bryobacteraceae bacterium]|jgi:hypothetical protein|nr:hypothetical protein [Bryobacteraceae bacterium]
MKEPTPPMLRVRDWNANHENNRSRDLKQLLWVPVPNDLSSDSFVELVFHPDGAAHLGVWTALLMVASRSKPRGFLAWGNGHPHTPESLARLTRLPQAVVSAAIERVLAIGLLEGDEDKPHKKNSLPPHPTAGKPQGAVEKPQASALEGNGREHHHQEGIGKEKKGTQRAGDEIKTERSSAGSGTQPVLRTIDDEENPPEVYASPEDELKAIYQAKAGTPITIEVLSAIREKLELTGVGMGEFVAALKESHIQNEWRNPAGFLRDFSKRFRSKTRVAARPVTAAEAEARDYKCPLCHSKIQGEGIVLIDGKWVPCKCASPEYIARQRERGVFAPEEPPK